MDKQVARHAGTAEQSATLRDQTIGRLRNSIDQLELYSRAFGRTTQGPNNTRVEFLVDADPDDEIVTISVSIPSIALRDTNPTTPVLRLSTLKGGDRRAVETTGITVLEGDVGIVHQRDHSAVEFFLEGDVQGPLLRFEFKAWELVGPTEGSYPYVFAELAFVLSLPSIPASHSVVTIRTSKNVTPRSTHGNFALAYPSRTHKDERYLNLYYLPNTEARVKYRFGTRERLVEPWLALGRAAVSAVFLFIVTALAGDIDATDRLLAVIAFFVAVATVVWDLASELSRFSIYGKTKRTIYAIVLSAQVLVVVTFLIALIGLRDKAPNGVLEIASLTSGILAVILGITASIGFCLHFVGRWHGYQCDIEGCDSTFKVRRGRPECRYTGRVPCDKHVESLCSTCAHFVDLRDGSLSTVNEFDPQRLPCASPNESAGAAIKEV